MAGGEGNRCNALPYMVMLLVIGFPNWRYCALPPGRDTDYTLLYIRGIRVQLLRFVGGILTVKGCSCDILYIFTLNNLANVSFIFGSSFSIVIAVLRYLSDDVTFWEWLCERSLDFITGFRLKTPRKLVNFFG